MNLKKFAIRGLAVLAIFVALCMFFSGTIKTITTAKIKIVQGRNGKLEEKIELSGKLVFSEVDKVGLSLSDGAALSIVKVNARQGYTVKEGDVIVEARVAGYEASMKQYQSEYDAALDSMLQLESKNSAIRVRKSDEIYADAYFTLRDARKKTVAAKIEMDSLLNRERLSLPEAGAPEGASEALVQAIQVWRDAVQSEAAAQSAMDAAERYLPDDAVWAYISEQRGYQEKMDEAEAKMQALSELDGAATAIVAPHDGYLASISVKEGDTYDGSAELFSVTKADTMPVLRADVSEQERTIAEGTAVTISSERYGSVETTVASSGLDEEGKKYVDIQVTEDVIGARGSVYSMVQEETPLTVVYRARQATTLIPSSAVHGTGSDRYIFTVDTAYSSFGNSKMTVHKMSVNVLAEVGGTVSVEEDLGYYSIAYMEDRPISDGDTVMLYAD